MTDWNFADIYEAVAARVPDRPCQIQGDRVVTWGEFDAPRQRAGRRPPRRRPRPPGQGGGLPLQRPRVPRDATSPPSRAASRRSTPTTATGPRRSSTCSTTPTPRPWSSTPRSPSCSTAIRDRLPEGAAAGTCVADGTGAGPDWARRLRDDRRSAAPTGSTAPWGRSRRRPAAALHRRHHRHAEGRDVAPGRPVQRARRRRQRRCSASRRPTSVEELVGAASTRTRRGPSCCRLPADARHRPVLGAHRHASAAARSCTLPSRKFDADELWRRGRARCRPTSIVIVGQAFAGPMLEALDANPGALRPVERRCCITLVGRDVEPGEQGRPAAPHARRRSCSTRFGSSEAVGLGGSVSAAGAAEADGQVRARRQLRGVHRGRPAGRAGLRRARPGRRRRLHPGRLLQGRGEVGADLPHLRGPALERARRLGRGRTPTARCTCSAAARCASTPAARRSSPRRSRRR